MKNKTDIELEKQTIKWQKKAEKKLKVLLEKKQENNKNNILINAKCYIKDSYYFLDKKDYIRSFEAIVWAWAFMEIKEKF